MDKAASLQMLRIPSSETSDGPLINTQHAMYILEGLVHFGHLL